MQHRPKDLSILQRDNYLIEINYCEDTLILIITVGVVGECLVQVPAPACCGIITDKQYLRPLLRTRPPALLVCYFFDFAEMGATKTASGRLEVNLFLSEKRGGKSHFGIILVSALCHDESWYQLKHGLQTWAKVCLTSPPSLREKEATAQARHRGDGQV